MSAEPVRKTPHYVTLEISMPTSGQPGHIWAAEVNDSSRVFTIDLTEDQESIDGALEQLFVWANTHIDTNHYQVELVVWNKDDFARLADGIKWVSLNSLCFISYYAALRCMSAQDARLTLNPHNLTSTRVVRAQTMAKMFKNMITVSSAIEQLATGHFLAAEGFPLAL